LSHKPVEFHTEIASGCRENSAPNNFRGLLFAAPSIHQRTTTLLSVHQHTGARSVLYAVTGDLRAHHPTVPTAPSYEVNYRSEP